MDELTSVFDVNMVGEESGTSYVGTFKVRTLLSRQQLARADMNRRLILGPLPEGSSAMPRVAADAFISGQLSVRVVEAPRWFENAGTGGIELFDTNVLEEIFRKSMEAEDDRRSKLNQKADAAAEKLKKKASKE